MTPIRRDADPNDPETATIHNLDRPKRGKHVADTEITVEIYDLEVVRTFTRDPNLQMQRSKIMLKMAESTRHQSRKIRNRKKFATISYMVVVDEEMTVHGFTRRIQRDLETKDMVATGTIRIARTHVPEVRVAIIGREEIAIIITKNGR
jgi:hypothetical protein